MLASLHINVANYFVVSISLLKENIYTFVGRKITLGWGLHLWSYVGVEKFCC